MLGANVGFRVRRTDGCLAEQNVHAAFAGDRVLNASLTVHASTGYRKRYRMLPYLLKFCLDVGQMKPVGSKGGSQAWLARVCVFDGCHGRVCMSKD